jgi:hypothetical protein
MEPEGLFPRLQEPATCPYPEPARCRPYPTSHFLKFYFNINLPSTPGSSQMVSIPQVSPPKSCIPPSHIPYSCYIPRPSHYSRFDRPNNIGEEYKSLSFSVCSFLHSPVTSSLLGQNVLLNTLFSNTVSLRSLSTWASKVHTCTKQQTKLQFCIS